MAKLKKWLPLLIILSGFGLAYFMGWFKYLNPQLLVENADDLQNLVSNNFILVLLGFIALYAILTVFMLPASILTVASGFLFGTIVGAPAVVVDRGLRAIFGCQKLTARHAERHCRAFCFQNGKRI